MKKISIIGQKGGDGKTTLAIGLAVAAAEEGSNVLIIDLDPQASCAQWRDQRDKSNPAVISAQAARLEHTLKTAQEYGVDLVIIDTPGRSDSTAIEAARSADLVLIPVRPQFFGLKTLSKVRDILALAGWPKSLVIMNCIHPRATTGVDSTTQLIEKSFGLTVSDAHLCHRTAYADAPATGRSAQELDPSGRAADELRSLYMSTLRHLYNNKSQHADM